MKCCAEMSIEIINCSGVLSASTSLSFIRWNGIKISKHSILLLNSIWHSIFHHFSLWSTVIMFIENIPITRCMQRTHWIPMNARSCDGFTRIACVIRAYLCNSAFRNRKIRKQTDKLWIFKLKMSGWMWKILTRFHFNFPRFSWNMWCDCRRCC